MRRAVKWNFALCLIAVGVSVAAAQNYPSKVIRIVTAEAGGGSDQVARLIALGITAPLGQQVIVENRGGSSVIPAQIVVRASPDGYSLLFYGAAIWLNALLQENVPYDVAKDFAPITLAASTPNIIVVPPSLPVKSVRDLIALAKARPGELNYGSGATGTSNHLAAELFNAMAGVKIVRVGYKGIAAVLNDVIAGRLQVFFTNTIGVMPHVKSGRLRALAVTSAQPSALAPDLPTVAASGLPGYESGAMFGIWAPAKTPAAVVNRLNQEIVRFINTPEAKERFLISGTEAVGTSSEQFAGIMKDDMVKWGKIIKDLGIRSD